MYLDKPPFDTLHSHVWDCGTFLIHRVNQSINQSIMSLLTYDKTHILTK